jgi:hypothetical protein
MTDQTEEQHAQEKLKDYKKTINSTPALTSLLYDADLLPEQIITIRGAVCCAAVVIAYGLGQKSMEKNL